MIEKHLYTSDEKFQWWGYDEWVEEPDEVEFEHEGIKCRICRVAVKEPYVKKLHIFGGYLCGYVCIPSDHSYYHKIYENMEIRVHGGLTFGEVSDGHWIGFDCGHFGDYVPSLEYLKKTAPWMQKFTDDMQELKDRFNLHDSPIFNKSYKNIEFCIGECKSMAEQLNAITKMDKS